MDQKKTEISFYTVCILIVLAAFSRLIPHMPNFSPLGAIALFGAACFRKIIPAILIPITATWLSDLVINNVQYAAYYPTFTWITPWFYWTYTAYALIAVTGLFLFRKINLTRIITGALLSSAIFFLLTNLACLPSSNSPFLFNIDAILSAYQSGLPYLKGTLAGDLFYTVALFGIREFILSRSRTGIIEA